MENGDGCDSGCRVEIGWVCDNGIQPSKCWRDLDGDGVTDTMDSNPNDPHICSDLEGDGCDDCSVAGRQMVYNDGPDADHDGICDASDPQTCGNSIQEPGEECDNTDFGIFGNGAGQCSNFSVVYTGGSLSCTSECKIDFSGCTGSPPPLPAQSGIVAYYTFDNSLKDKSGSGLDAIAQGSVSFVQGRSGWAVEMTLNSELLILDNWPYGGVFFGFNSDSDFSIGRFLNRCLAQEELGSRPRRCCQYLWRSRWSIYSIAAHLCSWQNLFHGKWM